MELTYKVRGADGKEYGPVTLQQLTGWVGEGRLPPQQQVQRSDMSYWAAASDFAELQPLYAPAASPAASPAAQATSPPQAVAVAAARTRSGASWFYWIAGLSLVNSVVALTEANFRFVFGLGTTQIFDAVGASIGGGGKAVALALDVLAAGVFVVLGIFAHKGHLWAFIVGMVLFALDGLLLLGDWLGVGIHVFVLYCLFRGFNACRQLKGA